MSEHAYLLYENFWNGKIWKDRLEHVALTPADASAWVGADFPQGYSRTSIRITVYPSSLIGSDIQSPHAERAPATQQERSVIENLLNAIKKLPMMYPSDLAQAIADAEQVLKSE